MLRRSITLGSLALIAAVPIAAQQHKDHDPDIKVAGGALPKGWSGRTDKAGEKLADAKFVTMGTGFHVTSGPAAIYWSKSGKTKGPFTASATFRQTKNPAHPEAYGIFFQGNKLETPKRSYAYLLVRGDGKFMVNHRASAVPDVVHKIIDWTENAAVKKADANGVATNTVGVDASRPDSVRLTVNGVQVAALPGAHIGNTDGYVGLRVNHNLDVHISDFVVTPTKK